MAIDKLTLAANILSTLNRTVCCNGLYYFYNKKYYQELSDFDLDKLIRNYFQEKKMTAEWSRNISKDISAAIKIQIAEENEVDLMDYYDSYIPIENGIVNLSNLNKVEVIPHSDKYLFTYNIPVTWSPENEYEEPKHFIAFLESTFRNRDGTPNEDLMEIVLFIFAYIIYPSIMMEKWFMFLGDGENGKSFLISIMQLFFKDDHVTYASLQTLSEDQSNNRDFLLKSRLNIAGEQKGIKIDPEELKKIASGQALQIILRYKGNFSFKPKTKLIVDSNNLPFFADNTRGTKRRLCVVNFENSFPEDDDYREQQRILSGSTKPEEYENYNLSKFGIYKRENGIEMLDNIKKEINEIFNLLVLYIHRLKERKWQLPKNKETQKAMQKYEEGTDFVKMWLLRNFRNSRPDEEGIMPLSMSYIFQKFQQDYIAEFGTDSRFKKNTITKRIGEIFKDDGERKNIKDTLTGEYRKDRVFQIIEKIKFDN